MEREPFRNCVRKGARGSESTTRREENEGKHAFASPVRDINRASIFWLNLFRAKKYMHC